MTTPIDIAELRRLIAEATPGPWLRPRTGTIEHLGHELVAAVNSLGPLLDELETARRENYDLRDGQFVPALTADRDAARAHVRELEAQCVEALADNVRLSAERDAARAEAAKLREALECVATTEPDGLCWCNPIIHADTRAAFGHAGWCKKARAALGKEKL